MSTQSEALRLADALGIVSVGGPLTVTMHEAAAELRRLLSESLRIEALHAQAQRELFDAKEEVERLRQVSYDLLGELTAHRAAQSLRQASEDLRARTTGNRPLTTEQMRGWIEETWQRCQDEAWADGQAITIGNFTLSRYDEASYWLAHASGEGMQVRQDRLQRLIDELWQEF